MRSAVFALLVGGCDLQAYDTGADEPIRVSGASFHRGPLPNDDTLVTPAVINAGAIATVVTQGQRTVKYSGLASKDTFSIGVALPDLGDGYWVIPVDGPDATQDNNLLFSLNVEVGAEVPYGLQTISFVAIGGDAAGGPRYDAQICILPDTANGNLSACDPATPPQSAVVSLWWDTPVDLDLVVVTPDGKVVSGKAPTTAFDPEATATTIPSELVTDESTGTITRDSNRDCDIDGVNLESLIFPGEPPPGIYRIYASLNRACGESYVNFATALYRRVDNGDETFSVEETPLPGGELIAAEANGGATLGLFVVDLQF